MAESARHETYRFRDFELDVPAYVLRRGGRSARLERQPMDLLILLVRHRHQLVSRRDIVEHLWGKDVFVDVDTGINTAISKIRHVLGDTSDAPTFVETVSGKGYRFVAEAEHLPEVRGDAQPVPPGPPPGDRMGAGEASHPVADAPAPRPARRVRHAVVGGAVGLVALALAGSAWVLRSPRSTAPPPAMHMVPLTSMTGSEYGAAFAPDGRSVAFGWDGETQENFDVYVKRLGTSDVRRLTSNPHTDMTPAWSPDGRQIAYLRFEPPYLVHQVRVMSSLGGSDRKVGDFPAWWSVTWSRDGRYLLAARATTPREPARAGDGIYALPLDGGEPRAITQPRPPDADQAPALSPDGRRLAYASCGGVSRSACVVNVMAVDSTLAAAGPPRSLTHALGSIRWLTWSRDGASVVYGDGEPNFGYLWRVAAEGGHPPERIEVAGVNAVFPSIAPSGDRLAFSRPLSDVDIYRFEPGRPALPIAPSAVIDDSPQFSPDGHRVAFCSMRSGSAVEVWLADSDGTSPVQLTHGPGRWQGSPSWSPDGRELAFDSRDASGNWHVWVVDARGGTPQQVTEGPGDQNRPTWSRDGEWIYFSWKQHADRDIWRVRVNGRTIERVTKQGSGDVGHESHDGRSLLYAQALEPHELMAQPLAGGPPRRLLACVTGGSVAVGRAGVYYVPCWGERPPDTDALVRVLDPATGRDREVGRLPRFEYDTPAFTVSPDGRVILYARTVSSGADLMMLENFR